MLQPKGKQGTRGSKQIVEENVATLKFYRIIIAAAVVTNFLANYVFFWDAFLFLQKALLAVCILIYLGGYQFMALMSRVRRNEQGVVVDSGLDLNMKDGMAEHAKDLILLTAITQLLSLFTSYLWLLLLLAPGRAAYMLWVNIVGPWFFAPAPEPVDDKKQKKMERRMMKFKRV